MQLSSCIANEINAITIKKQKFFQFDPQFSNMRVTYHCLPCKKEFIDLHMAKKHSDSTGHEFMERER